MDCLPNLLLSQRKTLAAVLRRMQRRSMVSDSEVSTMSPRSLTP